MIFNKEFRTINIKSRNSTVAIVCNEVKLLLGTNFKISNFDDKISVVTSFKWFNFGLSNVAKGSIEAVAHFENATEGKLVFRIKLGLIAGLIFIMNALIIMGAVLLLTLTNEYEIGFGILSFALVGFTINGWMHKMGMKKFLKEWDASMVK